MTQEEIEAAANADPDARPFTPEELAKARHVPRVKMLRRALGLTQEEFAARSRLPLGILRDWEQGRSDPDQPARGCLTVIAHDPGGVRNALASSGTSQERLSACEAHHLVTARMLCIQHMAQYVAVNLGE